MEYSKQNTQLTLQKISNILMINGGFSENPGLYSGETGIALFFFHYGHFAQNEIYTEYGFEMIEKIQSIIHQQTPIDYRNGLSGIGSTIEYLVQNEYIEAETDEVLEDIDNRLFDVDNLNVLSLDELFDTGYYTLWRLLGNSLQKKAILRKFLPELVHSMEEQCNHLNEAYWTVTYLREIIETENILALQDQFAMRSPFRPCYTHYPYGFEINAYNHFMEQFKKGYFDNDTFELGLQSGIAGFGMALMTELGDCDKWIALLPNYYSRSVR